MHRRKSKNVQILRLNTICDLFIYNCTEINLTRDCERKALPSDLSSAWSLRHSQQCEPYVEA